MGQLFTLFTENGAGASELIGSKIISLNISMIMKKVSSGGYGRFFRGALNIAKLELVC